MKIVKCFLIIFIITLPSICSSSDNNKKIFLYILSSPQDYNYMHVIGNDFVYESNAKFNFNTGKYLSFNEAYGNFYSEVHSLIKEDCKKKLYDGAVNLKTTFQVDEKTYYFAATFDPFF